MDDEFPDPDDEFDLVHDEEYEVLRELEEKSCRKQLVFKSPQSQNVPPNESGAKQLVENVRSTVQKSAKELALPIASTQPESIPAKQVEAIATTPVTTPVEKKLDNVETNGISKKRTVEDLFGEIDDLFVDDEAFLYNEPKVKKPCWKQDETLIDVIVNERKKRLEKWQPSSLRVTSMLEPNRKESSISAKIPSWNFIALTRSSDCQRLYVRVKSDSNYAVIKSRPACGLLSVSFSQLKAEADNIILDRAKKLSEAEAQPEIIPATLDDELWVDKYRPNKYMELLSDEDVNRTFLQWLKLWDKIVFHRDPIKLKRSQSPPKFGRKKFINKNIEGLDPKGFPVARIVLLSGPPGLGKTTLAHLAARHAGYNVVEINASDDRGTMAFRQALVASTQMKAVMGTNRKPNCLIMDEVDGAPSTSIDLLLQFIHGKLNTKSKKKKDGTKKEPEGCRRPIICICNDAYAPSLRAMRAVALVIPFTGISAEKLACRLMDILEKQGLPAEMGSLFTLAERTGCDVRACLGALQYMGGVKAGLQMSVGLKDAKQGIFDCWRQILQVPRDRGGPLPMKERVRKVLRIAQSGETDRLVQGVFHNYPNVILRDDGMESIIRALNWFRLYDQINEVVRSQQTWSLMPYTNYAFVAWHFDLAGMQPPKLAYPSTFAEAHQKMTNNEAILSVTRRACGIDKQALIFDLAPLLTDLLTPSLRSVSAHLYSATEKADLTRLINVMLDLGLTLIQEKNLEGGYDYNIEPNLQEIGTFPECTSRRSLTYAVKQIIVQELEAERIRRLDKSNASSSITKSVPIEKPATKRVESPMNPPSTPNVPNHLQTLTPILKHQTSPEVQQYRDFFGRIVTKTSQNQNSTSGQTSNVSPGTKQALSQSDIWFKYKEGYSNAVRRKVRTKDLL